MELELATTAPLEVIEARIPPGGEAGPTPDDASGVAASPNLSSDVVDNKIEIVRADSSHVSAGSGDSSQSTDKNARLAAVQVVASYTDIWMLGEEQ